MGNPNASLIFMRSCRLVRSVCLLTLAGCATQSSQLATQPQTPPGPSAAAPQSAPPEQPDPLKEAAARPSAPFEGEGWQSLFDGRTLTGWRETHFSGRGEIEPGDGLIRMK